MTSSPLAALPSALAMGGMVLLLAWVGHQLPLARPPLSFGFPVREGYAQSAEGWALLRWYRRVHWAGVAVALVVCVLAPPWGPLPVPLTMLGAFYHARARVRPHRVEPEPHLRRASLAQPVPNWIWAAMLPPLLFLAACALALYFAWDRIPERFPIHWGADGAANGWATRTPRKVFGTVIIGVATWGLLSFMLAGLLYGTRRSPGQQALLRASVFALVMSTWAVAALLGVLSLQPLAPDPQQPLLPFWAVLGIPVALMAVTLVPLVRAMSAPADPQDAAQFASGEFYANASDPAWLVPKSSGLGYTINFGHPIGRYVFPLVMLLFSALVGYVAR